MVSWINYLYLMFLFGCSSSHDHVINELFPSYVREGLLLSQLYRNQFSITLWWVCFLSLHFLFKNNLILWSHKLMNIHMSLVRINFHWYTNHLRCGNGNGLRQHPIKSTLWQEYWVDFKYGRLFGKLSIERKVSNLPNPLPEPILGEASRVCQAWFEHMPSKTLSCGSV